MRRVAAGRELGQDTFEQVDIANEQVVPAVRHVLIADQNVAAEDEDGDPARDGWRKGGCLTAQRGNVADERRGAVAALEDRIAAKKDQLNLALAMVRHGQDDRVDLGKLVRLHRGDCLVGGEDRDHGGPEPFRQSKWQDIETRRLPRHFRRSRK